MRNILNNTTLKKLGAMGLLIALPALNACNKKEDPKPAQHDTTYILDKPTLANFVSSTQAKASADSSQVRNVIIQTSENTWNMTNTAQGDAIVNSYLKPVFDVSPKVIGKGTFILTNSAVLSNADSSALVKYGFVIQRQK